ncbi:MULTISPECIES: energy transducer TonB [unclassified Polaribacter]|uniref:energy transducer TonB n=1 Tax=unclassified Polaribacter TaxID=196858 RepID=UPI0011BEC03B|nr:MULTISPECIES: energy transducer TonB [unclassified Polaribacter]TXD50556.1 energy transducer TonB [Polaribacter sp. IC063]TXD62011.1 energy transducer TonB [Polaribacter sp. IC066]
MLQIKKNPKKQLANFSKIFMQIGLALTLFIVYSILEYKTFEKVSTANNRGEVQMVFEMTEDIPIVPMQQIKPTQTSAPPPPSLDNFKVVEDDVAVIETVLESTETDEHEIVTNALITTDDIVEVAEVEEIIEDIPFLLIEDVPIYPGCKGNNKELKACFTKEVTKYFGENFDVGLSTELGLLPGKKRLFVVFTIDKSGSVINIKVRGPHPALEKEVTGIINSLPKMTPGKQRGIPVGVSYSLPITFEVRE